MVQMVHNPIPGRRQIIQKTQMANKLDGIAAGQNEGKVDFHAKSFSGGLRSRVLRRIIRGGTRAIGVVIRQTPAIIVTKCSEACNFFWATKKTQNGQNERIHIQDSV